MSSVGFPSLAYRRGELALEGVNMGDFKLSSRLLTSSSTYACRDGWIDIFASQTSDRCSVAVMGDVFVIWIFARGLWERKVRR
jgi:hypothetical protein